VGPLVGSPESFRRFAEAAGTPLLGIELLTDTNGWRVTGGNPVPDLLPYGTPVIDALAHALVGDA
jgi:hypothetical protein